MASRSQKAAPAPEENLLPTDTDAERLVLGSIMIGAITFGAVAATLDTDAFALEAHRRIWQRMGTLHERGGVSDRVMLQRELEKHGELESVGGLGYLVSLDDGLPTLPNIDGYMRRLREFGERRRIIRKSAALATSARMETVPTSEIAGSAAAFFREIGLSNGIGGAPAVFMCDEVIASEVAVEQMLFDGFPVPSSGAVLEIGASKTGKTLLAVQQALAVASGAPLFDYYKVIQPGPVMIIEVDDPSGNASIGTILNRSGARQGLPLCVVPRLPFGLGPQFLDWLEQQIEERSLRLIVIDSFTAMRGPRRAGVDLVKLEATEVGELDALAKRLNVAIIVIHHGSKGSAGLDWTQSAAGSFAMTAATEGQIHMSRFPDLEGGAAERLVRIRGRHAADLQLALRFVKETLNFGFILEGGAAEHYPVLRQINAELGRAAFGPKDLSHVTGSSIATANRLIGRLRACGALNRHGLGNYELAVQI